MANTRAKHKKIKARTVLGKVQKAKLNIKPTTNKAVSNSKQQKLIDLLKSPAGATLEEMIRLAGWQRHSIHGMLSGVLRKKLGYSISFQLEERGRVYRITV